MDRAFETKTVLITGAAGGFGRALAQRFAGEGARLVLSDLSEEGLRTLAGDLDAECVIHAGDVSADETARAQVALVVERFGRLDIAINNAGIANPFMRLEAMAAGDAEKIIAVDLIGVIHAMRHQIAQMRSQFEAEGRLSAIVNMASIAGIIGASGLAAYAAAKHGVVGLTKSAALENARRGIRINAICPTFSPTAMVTEGITSGGVEVDKLASGIPMRRLAAIDEVVEAVVFAASDKASFTTGQAIPVDGGLMAG